MNDAINIAKRKWFPLIYKGFVIPYKTAFRKFIKEIFVFKISDIYWKLFLTAISIGNYGIGLKFLIVISAS